MLPVAHNDLDTIPIRVRYVAKDLWIQVDIARNVSVQTARDIVLSRCQLTLAPSSAPLSTTDTIVPDSQQVDAHLTPTPSSARNSRLEQCRHDRPCGSGVCTSHSHANKVNAAYDELEGSALNNPSRAARRITRSLKSDLADRAFDEISVDDSDDDHKRLWSAEGEVEVIEVEREDQDDCPTDQDDDLSTGTHAQQAQPLRPASPTQQPSDMPLSQPTSKELFDAAGDISWHQQHGQLKKKRSLMSSSKALLSKSPIHPPDSSRRMSDQPPQPQPASRSSSAPNSTTTSMINQEPPSTFQKDKRGDTQHRDRDRDNFHVRSHPADEDEAVMRAEELMARLDMFSESINAFGGVSSDFDYARSITQSNHLCELGLNDLGLPQDFQTPPRSKPKRVQSHSSGIVTGADTDSMHSAKTQVNSSSTTNYGLSVAHLAHGWTPWRDRNAGKVPTREHPDIGAWTESAVGDIAKQKGGNGDSAAPTNESSWKSAFGLFWVSAGHWLDESRQVSSYTIQPYELFELQLRNDYIQLPPPGSDLTYSDHYAEGILFKLSKKSRPDQVKKTIIMPKPLTITTRGLPQVSRNLFKFNSPSADSMSATMIALDVSPDPNMKLCFRGSSENDINHWQRIFHSLNEPTSGSLADRASEMSGHAYSAGDEGDISGLHPSSSSVLRGVGSFPYKRQRHHTAQSAVSMASTMPSINPVLILNAAAALSNFNTGSTGNTPGQADGNIEHHVRNLSLSNSSKLGQYPALHHHSAAPFRPLAPPTQMPVGHRHAGPLAITSLAAKDDVRRRASTEPSKYKLLNGARGQLKTLRGGPLIAETSDVGNVSNISEVPFRLTSPPGRRRKPVLGTEYLDSASEALLANSSARSSMAPLYSGYIWLYIPNANDDSFSNNSSSGNSNSGSNSNSNASSRSPSPTVDGIESEISLSQTSHHTSTDELSSSEGYIANVTTDNTAAVASVVSTGSLRPSTSTTPPPSNSADNGSSGSTSRAGNISMSKATGRYVKCFAAINEHGQLQWVEVKKQNELAVSAKTTLGVSSRPSYGIPLRSDVTESLSDSNSSLPQQHQQPFSGPVEAKSGVGGSRDVASTSSKDKSRMVQVCMAQKLRLFFFCIVISPASMSRVMMERTATITTASTKQAIPSPLSNVVEAVALQPSAKTRQRLSATFAAVTAAAAAAAAAEEANIVAGSSYALPPLPHRPTCHTSLGGGGVHIDAKAQDQEPGMKKSVSPPLVEMIASDANGGTVSYDPSPRHIQSLTDIEAISVKQGVSTTSENMRPSATGTETSGEAVPKMDLQSLKKQPQPRPRPETPPPLATVAAVAAANARAAEENKRGSTRQESDTSLPSSRPVLSSPVSLPNLPSSTYSPPVQRSSISKAGISMISTSPESCWASSPDGSLSSVAASPVSPVMARAQSLQKAFRMMQQHQHHHQHQHETSPDTIIQSEKPKEMEAGAPSMKDSIQTSTRQCSPIDTPNLPCADTDIATATAAVPQDEPIRSAYESCPFLEFNPPGSMSSIEISGGDEKDGGYLTLRGYTETEEEWRALQMALERFVHGPTKDLKYALPPMDTLIPSYHSPPLPEVRLSEKAQNFLNAKPVSGGGMPASMARDQINHHHRHYYSPHARSGFSDNWCFKERNPKVILRVVNECFGRWIGYWKAWGIESISVDEPIRHTSLLLSGTTSEAAVDRAAAIPQQPAPALPTASQNHYHAQTPLTVTATVYPLNDLPDLDVNLPVQHLHLSQQVSHREEFALQSSYEMDHSPSSGQGKHPGSNHYNHNNHNPMLQGYPMNPRNRSRDQLSLSMGAASLHQGSRTRPRLNAQRSADELGKSNAARLPAPRPTLGPIGGHSSLMSGHAVGSGAPVGGSSGSTTPHINTTMTNTTILSTVSSPTKKREKRLSGTGLGLWLGSHAADMIGLKSSKRHQQHQQSEQDAVVKDDSVASPTIQRRSNGDARLGPIVASPATTTVDSKVATTGPSSLKKSESSSTTITALTTSSTKSQNVGTKGGGGSGGAESTVATSTGDHGTRSGREVPSDRPHFQDGVEGAMEPVLSSQVVAEDETICVPSRTSGFTDPAHGTSVSPLRAESGPSWYHHAHPQTCNDGQHQHSGKVFGSARSRTTTAEGGLVAQHPQQFTPSPPVVKGSGVYSVRPNKNGSNLPPHDHGELHHSPPQVWPANIYHVGHRQKMASPLMQGHATFTSSNQTATGSARGAEDDIRLPDRDRSSSSKKQSSVMGASKAAVNGVLGIFRKSVG
ncbi:hypothetical protein DFQ27_001297 [Actinomortierella ambigua]|uniref:PH domain-containing protein n=1 Tax=Actinomortierella ambigua TaxID=1343610 RepID=A0A9P6QBQ3_9FUNG|nr:hypothetical protein DFQ27_001297 [Actinomortierella ambigua]